MKILLVEDDTNLLNGLVELLELEDFTIRAVDNHSEAESIASQFRPDICILDIMLPDGSGLTLCRKLRQLIDTRVIFLSARGDENDRIRGFEAGADDYVTKPFNSVELIHRLKALYRRSNHNTSSLNPDANSPPFYMADLKIHPESLRAYRDNQCIELTEREYAILLQLYKAANSVVRKGDLYEHCWGLQYIPDSRALDQYILALRQKIEIDPRHPAVIHTVRGTGYRYEC